MGQSTDAILVYGIELPEGEEPAFMEGFDEFDDFITAEKGLPYWGEPGHDYGKNRAAVESYPVDLVSHCYIDCPMYILAVRGTKTKAGRGYPKEITTLGVEDKGYNALIEFAKKHNIEGEPKWILCSYWG